MTRHCEQMTCSVLVLCTLLPLVMECCLAHQIYDVVDYIILTLFWAAQVAESLTSHCQEFSLNLAPIAISRRRIAMFWLSSKITGTYNVILLQIWTQFYEAYASPTDPCTAVRKPCFRYHTALCFLWFRVSFQNSNRQPNFLCLSWRYKVQDAVSCLVLRVTFIPRTLWR